MIALAFPALNRHPLTITLALLLSGALAAIAGSPPTGNRPEQALAEYRAELEACRRPHGGSREMPDVKFFLFGLGHRAKFIYRDGVLLEAMTQREVRRWTVRKVCCVSRLLFPDRRGPLHDSHIL
ncbi:MAG: hypothetical protein QOE70_761 [Chthoniobacter sp.]|jgi:hypothetical protein|nr:hypothetical protein [Chthoniobacter sp.]